MTCSRLLCTWCCLHSLHPYFVLHGMSGVLVGVWCGVCGLLSVYGIFSFQFILALRIFTYVYILFHSCRIWCTMDKQIPVLLFTERFCSLSHVFIYISSVFVYVSVRAPVQCKKHIILSSLYYHSEKDREECEKEIVKETDIERTCVKNQLFKNDDSDFFFLFNTLTHTFNLCRCRHTKKIE